MKGFAYLSADLVLGLSWSFLASSCVLIQLFPQQLNFISRHGKTRSVSTLKSSAYSHGTFDRFVRAVSEWNVPKSYFIHMYLVGFVGSMLALFYDAGVGSISWKGGFMGPNMVPLCLFFVHVSRRLLECCFMTDFGSSVMHVFGYAVGILHYILAPLTLVSRAEDIIDTKDAHGLGWFGTCVVVFFLVCNACQFYFHKYFYNLKVRARRLRKNEYSFPHGFGFDSVCCPHYTAECCLYICLWLLQPRQLSTACMGVWVGVNLATVAGEHWRWYNESFPEQSARSRAQGWKRIWPGVY